MRPKNSNLADRFKRAVIHDMPDTDDDAERAAIEERATEARLAIARKELLADVVGFAKDLGDLVRIQQRRNGLDLVRGDRLIALRGTDDGLSVGYGGEALDRLELEPSDTWVLHLHGEEHERYVFFDAGLEELLVRGLGLPRPEPTAAPAVAAPIAPTAPPAKAPTPTAGVSRPAGTETEDGFHGGAFSGKDKSVRKSTSKKTPGSRVRDLNDDFFK